MKTHATHFSLVLISVCALSFLLSAPATAEKIRLEDLPRLVREKNENVQASRQNLTAQTERSGRLLRSFLPQISAHIGQEEFKTGSEPADQKPYWRVDGSVNLYRGGRDRLDDQIRESQKKFAKTAYASEFNAELREAKQAFFKSIAIRKQIAERTEAIDKNEINTQSARKRAGAGLVTTADAAHFELHKITLQRERRRLELEYDLTLNQLSVALGLNEHENIEIIGDFPTVVAEPIAPLVTSIQLEISGHQELVNADELRAKQVARWLQPKLDLYASYGIPSLGDEYTRALKNDREWTAGLKLSFDLGQGIEDRKEASARLAEAQARRLRAAHKLREVVANDHDYRHDLRVLSELIEASDGDVKRAESFLRLTEREYARGVKNGPDLLEAFQKYFDFRDRRIGTLRDYFETKSALEYLVGGDPEP